MLTHAIITQELLTRHKSTVAEFLSRNYDWVSLCFIYNLEQFSVIPMMLINFSKNRDKNNVIIQYCCIASIARINIT
jgi:hypothetical protein